MLVLLGPSFDGSNDSYARLAQATGLVAYDLKSRLKPGMWGVVKALADHGAARDLAGRLEALGFEPVLINHEVAQDPERRIVPISSIELEPAQMLIKLRDRAMPVPYGALCSIVEGEVQPGRVAANVASAPSSSSFRVPSAGEIAQFREAYAQPPQEAYLAADLHFATVLWIARIDTRTFEFSERTGNVANDLASLLDRIAERAGRIRIDRSVKTSSISSFAQQAAGSSSYNPSWPPPSGRPKHDQRFDPYSRIVGEAERQARLGTAA